MGALKMICDVCCEIPCACEENNRDAELMAAKAELFDDLVMALKAVSAGIWRDKKKNTCGLFLQKPAKYRLSRHLLL